MKRVNYLFEAKQELVERNRTIGTALTISVAIALSFILAFVLWLEVEFGMLSNLWTSLVG